MTKETGIHAASATPTASGKREWSEPRIVVAEAREANVTFAPGGTADYGFYS